jgi:hypothetical protein
MEKQIVLEEREPLEGLNRACCILYTRKGMVNGEHHTPEVASFGS